MMAAPVLALSFGMVPTTSVQPTVRVQADGGDPEAARAYFASSLPDTDARTFDLALATDVQISHHIAAVTVHGRVVISDHRGVCAIVSASASARGRARAYALPQLRERATIDTLDAIAARIRMRPRA
jgi:hypothetical protein